MMIEIIGVLLLISFIAALFSYQSQKKEVDLRSVKKELKQKRVIYHKDSLPD
jgi:hypothetical protein